MKYSKIDIRNTVRNLIDYFKMQNEVPSQKEIVEVCKENRIEETGSVFLRTAAEIKEIVEV